MYPVRILLVWCVRYQLPQILQPLLNAATRIFSPTPLRIFFRDPPHAERQLLLTTFRGDALILVEKSTSLYGEAISRLQGRDFG
ncbi:hypothetical protein J3E68DRAFT_410984 [Trichoderma sp. SZMC 28012]